MAIDAELAPRAAHDNAQRNRVTGIVLTLLSGIAFAVLPVFNRTASGAGATVYTALGLRFAIAAAVMWLVWVRREPAARPGRQTGGLMLMGLFYVGQSACFFVSSLRIPIAVTSILLYLYPVFVTLLSWAFLHEPMDRRKLIALGLAFSGCVLTLGAPQVAGDWIGIGLGVAAAVVYSIYIVLGARFQRGVSSSVASFYVMLTAGAVFIGSGLLAGQFNLALPLQGYAAIVGLAIVCTVIALYFFLIGVKRIGPSRASILSTVEPVGTAVLGALVLGEGISELQVAGGVLVLAAVLLLSFRIDR